MWRGGRSLFLFGLALSLGGAQPPNRPDTGQQNASAQEAANTVSSAIREIRPDKDGGCEDLKDKRSSDLCAQWKAADAARDAANYSLLAVFLSFLGTGLIFFTFLEQKNTARAELRAYLFVESSPLFDGSHPVLRGGADEMVPRISISVRNFGPTPAHEVRHWAGMMLVEDPENFDPPEPDLSVCAFGAFAPNASQTYMRSLTFDPFQTEVTNGYSLTGDTVAAIKRGDLHFLIFGRITYKDVFRQMRSTRYRMIYSGTWPPLPDVNPRFAARGNKSD